jgi:hypothetical protein
MRYVLADRQAGQSAFSTGPVRRTVQGMVAPSYYFVDGVAQSQLASATAEFRL